MPNTPPSKSELLDAIRQCAAELGHPPSRSQFLAKSGLTEYYILKHFRSWRDAQSAAGVEPNMGNVQLADEDLLADWGAYVREHRHIPTRDQYRRDGKFSPSTFEKHFGPWSSLPVKFRHYANELPEWADVLALMPEVGAPRVSQGEIQSRERTVPLRNVRSQVRHPKLVNRPTYGDPIDFRGLRHEPVNEQGVVFLFGMVAKELGYMVEAVQGAYPDCEAKRQIAPNNWQRVRIEFEFESRNFRDHGHAIDGCDVIICWRHNWPECPEHLEVLELATTIKTLSKSED